MMVGVEWEDMYAEEQQIGEIQERYGQTSSNRSNTALTALDKGDIGHDFVDDRYSNLHVFTTIQCRKYV